MIEQDAPVPGFSPELHGLRGLAALMVACSHAAYVPRVEDGGLFVVRTLLNGSGALALFFVLSGLVLAGSLEDRPLTPAGFGRYLVRRACRLLPLLAVAVAINAAYAGLLGPAGPNPHASPWFDAFYKDAVTPARVLGGLAFAASSRINPPSWSIFVEIAGSALVPFMLPALRDRRTAGAVAAALALLAVAPLGLRYGWNAFLINFYVGVTALLWGPMLARRTDGLRPAAFWAGVAGLVLVFLLFRDLTGPYPHADWRANAVEVGAIAPVVALVRYRPRRFTALAAPAARFLGDVSYGLYLVHFAVLSAVFRLLTWGLPGLAARPSAFVLVLTGVVLAVSLPLAAFLHRRIERPGTALGRTLARGRHTRPA